MAQGMHLSQRMSLQQVLAPQLQQSLALLQAPTLELQKLVEQELEQNPVLEEVATTETNADEKQGNDSDGPSMDSMDPAEPPADVMFDPTVETPKAPPDDFQAEFDKLVQLDQEWRDHFSQTNLPSRHTQDDEEKRQFMFDSLVAETSLQEILIEQVRQSALKPEQLPIAEMIIGNIDERGYLQSSVDELSFSTSIAAADIAAVLTLIQTFHPPGVGARDVRECLMLQLERVAGQESLDYRIIRDHMELLGKRRLPDIARATGATVEEVQESVARISRLEPRPGRDFLPDNTQYIVPEVFVVRNGDEYTVTNNNDHIPRLRISNTYKDLMAQADSNAEVREYIRDKIRAGKFLIKSIHQRQQTILNIAREIVSRQKEFMEHGVSHLRPMTMVQVADVVKVHETTVSRAVSGKYIQTPQGLFEMKFFFTSGIATSDGSGVSNTSVKEIIADMIKNEDGSKPLSDDEIVKLLIAKEIKIARRTVAKYRSELNILPSHLRRVY